MFYIFIKFWLQMLHPVREPTIKRTEMTEVNGQVLESTLGQKCSQDLTRT